MRVKKSHKTQNKEQITSTVPKPDDTADKTEIMEELNRERAE